MIRRLVDEASGRTLVFARVVLHSGRHTGARRRRDMLTEVTPGAGIVRGERVPYTMSVGISCREIERDRRSLIDQFIAACTPHVQHSNVIARCRQ